MKFDYLRKMQERNDSEYRYYGKYRYYSNDVLTPDERIILQVQSLKEDLKNEHLDKRISKLKKRLNKILTERPELFV
jgi:hypothetical protein